MRSYLGRPEQRRFRALALRTALCRETGGEIGQESAEAVVAIKSVKADGAKG